MTHPPSPLSGVAHRLRRPFAIVAFICSTLALLAAPAATKEFNIAADDATRALKQFAAQSGEQLLYSPDDVAGVKTLAIQGTLTPREALEKMVEGTTLVVAQDKATGALAVRKETAAEAKNGASRLAEAQTAGTARIHEGKVILSDYEVRADRDTGIVNQGVVPRRENEGVRYQVIDRTEIARSGVTSLPEFFRSLPSNASFGTGSQNQTAVQLGLVGGFAFTTDGINLRGFGTDQTLIMINGRRLFVGDNGGADVSRIPLSAVERIEILATSGSAIYGANAVGGVINIILRKGYRGSEASLYAGTARGGAEEIRASLFHGGASADGRTSFNTSLEYNRKNALHLGDRRYYEIALARVLPGSPTYLRDILRNAQSTRPLIAISNPSLPPLGIPGAPTAAWALVPVGSNGIGLTPASFAESAGQPVTALPSLDRAKLVSPSESVALFSALEHELRNGWSAYSELSWRWADTSVGNYRTLATISIPANRSVNPFRTNVTPGFIGRNITVMIDPADLPDATSESSKQTFRAVAGLKGKFDLAARNFNWAVDFSGDRNDAESTATTYHLLLAPAIYAGFYNPFRDLTGAPLAAESELAKLRGFERQEQITEIAATNWRVNGELMELAGAPLNISLGFEARFERLESVIETKFGEYALLPGSSVSDDRLEARASRRAIATYGEVQLPLVGAQNRRPGIWSLDLSGAMRFEDYSDFGSAAPPMLAIKYAPVADIAIRASFSEGFQPPRQSSLREPVIDVGPYTFPLGVDPLRNNEPVTPTRFLVGGNPALRAETSETWDLGIILTPRVLSGLTLNASYYRYDKRDVVDILDVQDIISFVPSRVVRGANLPGDPVGMPGPIVQIDSTPANLARQVTSGWDFKADYRREVSAKLSLGAVMEGTYVLQFKQQSLAEGPFEDIVGEMNLLGEGPVKIRGKVRLWLSADRWSASWLTRYVHSYAGGTNTPTPSRPTRTGVDGDAIPRSIEHDVQVSYSFPARFGDARSAWTDWLAGTKFTVGALNVFDRTPPLRSSRLGLWHSLFNDPRQRFVYFEATKSF